MFLIKSETGTIRLTKEQLLQTLFQKIADVKKSDHEALAKTIADYLELSGALKTNSILQLLTLAFTAGYFYRIFLEKNNVEIELE